jgi:hypothetical protein
VTQKIAGETPEAIKAFAERGIREKPCEAPSETLRMRNVMRVAPKRVNTRPVNDPGAWDRPIVPTRKARVRAEVMKRRLEYERSERPVKKIGRSFVAQHRGKCVLCHVRFAERTMIAKASPKGYVHVDCANPEVAQVPEPEMTPERQRVREAIAKSRFSPREAG